MYKEAPGSGPGCPPCEREREREREREKERDRERDASACMRRHQASALAPVERERERLPRVQGGTRLSPWPRRILNVGAHLEGVMAAHASQHFLAPPTFSTWAQGLAGFRV